MSDLSELFQPIAFQIKGHTVMLSRTAATNMVRLGLELDEVQQLVESPQFRQPSAGALYQLRKLGEQVFYCVIVKGDNYDYSSDVLVVIRLGMKTHGRRGYA